jgi:hypothetical protein
MTLDELVALQQVLANIESGFVESIDDDPGCGLFSKHQIPRRSSFDIGHGRKVAIERQLVFAFHDSLTDFRLDAW